jgi:WD40 repeat protein
MSTVRLPHAGRVVNAVAFSPDSKALASVGGDGGVIDVTVRFWDPATGRERFRFEADEAVVNSVAFSPDGKTLATGGHLGADNSITLWDPATGKKSRRLVGHTYWVNSLTFSPDGRFLASGSQDKTVRLWDVAAGKEIRCFRGHRDEALSVAFSPDGKTLASASAWEDHAIRLWDVATGKPRAVLQSPGERFFGATSVCFSPDGKTLASAGAPASRWDVYRPHNNIGRLWDVAAGRELHTFESGKELRGAVAFSPDGKTLAVPAGASVRLLEVATGKEYRRLRTGRGELRAVLFSPDGKLLAAISGRAIRLWEVATGKELFPPVEEYGIQIRSGALSPDGKLLALAAGSFDGTVSLWEMATARRRRKFAGHQGSVDSVAFSADGRTLASGGSDGMALVWDVTGLADGCGQRTAALSLTDLERLWADLADPDAPRASRAVWALVQDPGHSLPFLRDRLRPVPPADPQQTTRLIAELDSDKFSVRERAAQQLGERAEAAAPTLREALARRPSLETRKRLTEILQRVKARVPPAEQLRLLRAVEALEHLGTPETEQVLKRLAGGIPGARLSQEAEAALQRLATRGW